MKTVSVPIPGPLTEARFESRPNRFVIAARLPEGEAVRAHLPDPGRLTELLLPGARLWLRRAASVGRRCPWSAVLVEDPDRTGLVSLDTLLANRLVSQALRRGALPELGERKLIRSEVAVGSSRFDFLLGKDTSAGGEGRDCLLEIKSVSLVHGGVGLFPDAVTARGTRHLSELTELTAGGKWQAAVLFIAQRRATRIAAAASIDPRFAAALEAARTGGVELLGRRCAVGLTEARLGEAIPVG